MVPAATIKASPDNSHASRPRCKKMKMPDTPTTQPPTAGRTDQTHRDLVKWTRAVAGFTFLLFLANAVSNFFIYQQWVVANRAQIDTREQLRAVVVFPGAQVVPVNDKDGKPAAYGFIAQFQNVGGTRTAKFNAWVSIHYFDVSVPNSLDLSKPWEKVEAQTVVI